MNKYMMGLFGVLSSTLITNTTYAHEFSDIYSFGDCLSDVGNIRRNIDNFSGDTKLFNEVMADYYLGRPVYASKDGGTIYSETEGTAFDVDTQLDRLLKRTNGKLDSNALYTRWVGANDVLQTANEIGWIPIIFDFVSGKPAKEIDFLYLFPKKIEHVKTQVQRMRDAGAHHILIPTIPNGFKTPAITWAITDFLTEYTTPILGYNWLEKMDAALREKEKNGVAMNDKERTDYIVQSLNEVLTNSMKDIPLIGDLLQQFIDDTISPTTESLLDKMYHYAAELTEKLTDTYNQEVDKALASQNRNVIRTDVAKLFDEIASDPLSYGIDTILVSPCNLNIVGVDASKCDYTDKSQDDGRTYLFSDGIHPSAYGHKIIADYTISIMDAPLFVASMRSTLQAVNNSRSRLLASHLQSQRIKTRQLLTALQSTPEQTNPAVINASPVSIFGGYTGTQTRHENSGKDKINNGSLGLSIALTNQFLVGGTVSLDSGEHKNSSKFRYDHDSLFFSVFAQYMHQNGMWGLVDTYYGKTKLDNIQRFMKFGDNLAHSNRTEEGNTNATSYGLNFKFGYDYAINAYVTTGPTLGYTWNHIEIDGYRESGTSSTAMHFYDFKDDTHSASIGWNIDTQALPVNPYMHLSYNHAFSRKDKSMRAAINRTATWFERAVPAQESSWLEATIGANATLFRNATAYAAFNYTAEDSKNRTMNYSIGLSYAF